MKNENALVTTNENQIISLNKGTLNSDIRKETSLNIKDKNQAKMLLKSMQNADFKLNDCVGQKIKCVGYYATEKEIEDINEETGEQIIRRNHVLMLFDEKGKSYVTGSNSCFNSFNDILMIYGCPTTDDPIELQVIKVEAQEKGHQFLKVTLVD